MYDAYASRDASISTAPLVLSEGLSSYLVNFEHTCSEQLVSAAVPRVFAAKWLSVRALTSAMHAADAGADATNVAAITQFLGVLRGRQNTGRVRAVERHAGRRSVRVRVRDACCSTRASAASRAEGHARRG